MPNVILPDGRSTAICRYSKYIEGYWWEGSTPATTPSTPASDIVGQDNKIGGIVFGVSYIESMLKVYVKRFVTKVVKFGECIVKSYFFKNCHGYITFCK